MIIFTPGTFQLHDPCLVDPELVIAELSARAFVKPGCAYNLVFLGCGDARCETEIWQRIESRAGINLGQVVFLDKTITATAVGNIQEACLKMAGGCGANAKMCWSFGELLTICKTFGKSNTLILGINAATHAYTPQQVMDIYSFMLWCAAEAQPAFINFMSGSHVGQREGREKYAEPFHWIYTMPWMDLAVEFITCKASIATLARGTDQCSSLQDSDQDLLDQPVALCE